MAALGAWGASTKVFQEKSFGDFSNGELKSTSLSSEGKLFPAPASEKVCQTDEALIWRIISRPGGTLFLSTGKDGKILTVGKNKKPELFCDLEEVTAFALALDAKGVLYAGASPGGKIYRIPEKNKPELFLKRSRNMCGIYILTRQATSLPPRESRGSYSLLIPRVRAKSISRRRIKISWIF